MKSCGVLRLFQCFGDKMVRFNDAIMGSLSLPLFNKSSGGNLPITYLQGNWKSVPQQSLLTLLAQYCYHKIDCIVLWFIFSRREDDPGPSCRKK